MLNVVLYVLIPIVSAGCAVIVGGLAVVVNLLSGDLMAARQLVGLLL